jgi:hypothetical protein
MDPCPSLPVFFEVGHGKGSGDLGGFCAATSGHPASKVFNFRPRYFFPFTVSASLVTSGPIAGSIGWPSQAIFPSGPMTKACGMPSTP